MAAITFPLKRPGSVLDRSGARVSVESAPQMRVRTRRGTRLAVRLTAVVLATALVLPLAESTQTAEAGKKFKTVTKTFSSNGQIDIPNAGTEGEGDPYPSIIDVDAFAGYKKARIKDVNLTLRGFSHTFPDNVDVMLALGNRRATVMSDVGDSDDANTVQLTLDDQAGSDLPNFSQLSSGTFRPTNETGVFEANPADDPFAAPAPVPNANVDLAIFNGAKPDGEWRLFVHDDANGAAGELAGGWKLEITAKVKNDKKKNKNKDEN
jgi:hypothetical protein